MNLSPQSFARIVDLGCGDAPYYPGVMPATKSYIGIDVEAVQRRAEADMSFLKGDALAIAANLRLGGGDLLVAVFSAHHIGFSRMLPFFHDAHAKGAELFLVDPVGLHPGGSFQHWARSVVSSGLRYAREGNDVISYFLRKQILFLLSREGHRHLVEDFRRGEPRPEQEIRDVVNEQFRNTSGVVLERAGALIFLHSGSRVARWMKACKP